MVDHRLLILCRPEIADIDWLNEEDRRAKEIATSTHFDTWPKPTDGRSRMLVFLDRILRACRIAPARLTARPCTNLRRSGIYMVFPGQF